VEPSPSIDGEVFLLYNKFVGRPRGRRNAVMVNGRVTLEQFEWLQARADELGGNLSAALRQTITDARLLEMARSDYKLLREEHPEFDIPPHDDDGSTRVVDFIVSGFPTHDVEDVELRREEGTHED
jgi:hypothetical protein